MLSSSQSSDRDLTLAVRQIERSSMIIIGFPDDWMSQSGLRGMMFEIKPTLDVEDSRKGKNPRGTHANESVSGKETFHVSQVL